MIRVLSGILIGCGLISATYAASVPDTEAVQLTHCLAAKINFEHKILASNKQFQVIELPSKKIDALVKLADKSNCGRFKNVTSTLVKKSGSDQSKAMQVLAQPKPLTLIRSQQYPVTHQEAVHPLVKQVEPNNIWQTLTSLTSFYNRSATSKTGVEAAEWLKSQFEQMVKDSGRTDTETWFVETGSYDQPSLVTVIGKDIKAPGIVIGAHMDTLGGRMPGAGDDGSGSSSVMEAARVILNSQLELKRPVYIIWYAAEERGLVGSVYVVEYFQEHKIPVHAAIQFDMTGFRNKASDETMWLFKDYTDTALTNFSAELIKEYIQVPIKYSKCGYACSDHASWMEEGIPAAFPCETSFEDHNPVIHTSRDTMDRLNLNHMTNFSKLAVAFAMELALA
jgi:leucyl aminopeptidase